MTRILDWKTRQRVIDETSAAERCLATAALIREKMAPVDGLLTAIETLVAAKEMPEAVIDSMESTLQALVDDLNEAWTDMQDTVAFRLRTNKCLLNEDNRMKDGSDDPE